MQETDHNALIKRLIEEETYSLLSGSISNIPVPIENRLGKTRRNEEYGLIPPPVSYKCFHILNGKEVGHLLNGEIPEEAVQPASLDISVERFYDKKGKELSPPIRINPYDWIVCEAPYGLDIESREWGHSRERYAALETRSRVARLGGCNTGFVLDGKRKMFIENNADTIRLSFANMTPNHAVIESPGFSPVQLVVFENRRHPSTYHDFEIDDEYVSMEKIGNLQGHPINLSPDIWIMKKCGEFSYSGSDEDLFEQASVDDTDFSGTDFVLGLSQETISCNSNPGYIYPFHIDDIENDLKGIMMHPHLLERYVHDRYFGRENRKLLITSNSGWINPGVKGFKGKVVFEVITNGVENPGKYFRPGEPFGFAVPFPCNVSDIVYKGNYNNQSGINI